MVAGLALSIATVPGWLQSQPNSVGSAGAFSSIPRSKRWPRRSAPRATPAGSPEEPRWFNLNQEIANYLPYFAPGQGLFLDYQGLLNFQDAAEDYLAVRQALKELPEGQRSGEGEPLSLKRIGKILRNIASTTGSTIISATTKPTFLPACVLFTIPRKWALCHLHGRIAIFAWRDPERPALDPSKGVALDVEQAAFGPKAEPAPPRAFEPPPRAGGKSPGMFGGSRPSASPATPKMSLYDFRYQAVEYRRQIDALGAGNRALQREPSPVPCPRTRADQFADLELELRYNDLFPAGATQPVRRLTPLRRIGVAGSAPLRHCPIH